MRITKATVVATGALAAFAVTSAAPAFAAAADTNSSDTNATVMTPVYEGQHQAADYGDKGAWGTPGNATKINSQLIAALNGADVTAVPIQTAASTNAVGVIAVAVPVNSAQTVVGDANNANSVVSYFQ